jgi:ADP-dependent NAD(P)H-hydrate dehydratase / NAD(P)H-hydrate epimerase
MTPVFNKDQIKKWDAVTIQRQSISSWQLMEKACKAITKKIIDLFPSSDQKFVLIAGSGNNGGDGFGVARMLRDDHRTIQVIHLNDKQMSDETRINHQTLIDKGNIQINNWSESLKLEYDVVIIDALLGIGTNRVPQESYEKIISWINQSNNKVISIDIPSGMLADEIPSWPTVKANFTLSLGCRKLTSLLPESGTTYGSNIVLNIGLDKNFAVEEKSDFSLVDKASISKMIKTRDRFTHKGNYGHACLVGGSQGMIGAAILSTKSCLRSGVGLVSSFVPECGYVPLQISVPEAMCDFDPHDRNIKNVGLSEKYSAIGIGCGLGIHQDTKIWLMQTLEKLNTKRILLDADALNIISTHNLPFNRGVVITPHPKEFDRLFGEHKSSLERIKHQQKISSELGIYIILKGHHSCLSTPEGEVYFNSTGNAGMACGGSGDVLSGLLTGLLAQDYSIKEACMIGMYLHGYAGDLAAKIYSQNGLKAGDIVDSLGAAFIDHIEE